MAQQKEKPTRQDINLRYLMKFMKESDETQEQQLKENYEKQEELNRRHKQQYEGQEEQRRREKEKLIEKKCSVGLLNVTNTGNINQ